MIVLAALLASAPPLISPFSRYSPTLSEHFNSQHVCGGGTYGVSLSWDEKGVTLVEPDPPVVPVLQGEWKELSDNLRLVRAVTRYQVLCTRSGIMLVIHGRDRGGKNIVFSIYTEGDRFYGYSQREPSFP